MCYSLFTVVSFTLMLIQNCNSFPMFNFIGMIEFTMDWVFRLVNVSYFNVWFHNLLNEVILKSNHMRYEIEVTLTIYAIVNLITLNWYFA